MTNPSQSITNLVRDYDLQEGKTLDYYKLHSNWCITKQGALKIREAEGIVYSMPEADITPVSIAYRATFTNKVGESIPAVGSCRWDSGKQNPESTHAPELAWKRLLVRGTLEILGSKSAGVYGDEEFTAEFRKHGYSESKTSGPASPQPATTQAPAPKSQTSGYVSGIAEPPKQPSAKAEAASKAPGWFDSAADLPDEWGDAMGKFCELTGNDRGSWETLILDHCGKFNGSNGWWKPSQKYPSFESIVYTVDPNTGKSKAGFAVSTIKKMRELLEEISSDGSTRLQVPNDNGTLDDFIVEVKGASPPAGEARDLAESVASKSSMPEDEDLPF